MASSSSPSLDLLPVEINKTSISALVTTVIRNLHNMRKLVLFYGATGVGKTTSLPYHLSTHLGRILVLVDSVALKNSLSSYMAKATDVVYLTKLEYILSPVNGPVLIDESHQPDHLTQHLVRRVATPQTFFLTSATSSHFSANPKDTLYPIKEIYDDRYTLEAIFKCKPLPFLSPGSSGYRTCVFAPNDRDAVSLASKYSGIPVFSVTAANYDKQIPLIKATKGPILVFSSPVMQTGVTVDLDVVIDLGLSNSVSFEVKKKLSHINVARVNSTFLERIQRRGRVGRLRRGIYVSANNSFSKDTVVHPYFQELYQRLSKPIGPKLRVQLLSQYHPYVTDDLLDENGLTISYWNNPTQPCTKLPSHIQYSFDDAKLYHAKWWDHTVKPSTIWAELVTSQVPETKPSTK